MFEDLTINGNDWHIMTSLFGVAAFTLCIRFELIKRTNLWRVWILSVYIDLKQMIYDFSIDNGI